MTDHELEKMIKNAAEEETPDILDDLLKETGLADNNPAKTNGPAAEDHSPAREVTPAGQSAVRKRTWRHLYTALVSAAAVALVFTVALNLTKPAIQETPAEVSTAVPGEPAVKDPTPEPVTKEAEPAPSVPAVTAAPERSEEIKEASASVKSVHVFASVCIDVNPSVEIEVDTENRVSSCRAVNEDGQKILGKLKLDGTDIITASYAIIGVMLADGYLNDTNNSVLLSVISDTAAQGEKLEKELSGRLSSYLDESIVGVAILGQYVKEDENLRAFAQEKGISEGKARIIKTLSSSVPRLTEESLLQLSTHDLLLIWNDYLTNKGMDGTGDAGNQVYSSFGTVNSGAYISRDEAANAAISVIGVDPASVSYMKVEFECENGIMIYEVEFHIGDTKYNASVNALSGELLYWNSESEYPDGSHDEDDDHDDYDEPDDDDDPDDSDYDDYDEPDDDNDLDDDDEDTYEQEYDNDDHDGNDDNDDDDNDDDDNDDDDNEHDD